MDRIFLKPFVFFVFLAIFLQGIALAQPGTNTSSRNDNIFPAHPSARRFIDFDSRGFLVNGKRTFIVSAGMEYARVPRGLWRDRLMRLKRGGFNAVEVYTFWNYHEPKEGEFDFSGDRDLNAFLTLVKSMGMYAIVRVGPYYCGEWNFGGYPIWLKFKPGLRVREDNPQFLAAVDRFFNKLIPIVAKNQINRGGAVIMVQLENEHNAGWGTITPNSYFRHLAAKTISLGLRVPYYFSGLHPGNDPASNLPSLDDPARPNPWFSAEYWSVWFSNYGAQPSDSATYGRRTWKIIAHGGNGYNVYMAHGGSNFEYNNDRDMAASYDYGAAVGQGGDLRPVYYAFKRAAWFARSFQDILANSQDASSDFQWATSDSTVETTARRGPSGSIVFLNNPEEDSVSVVLNPPTGLPVKDRPSLKLAGDEIMGIVQDFSLSADIKLAWAPVRIYCIIPREDLTTLLVHGEPRALARLYFNISTDVKLSGGVENFTVLSPGVLGFSAEIPVSKPAEYAFQAGGKTIRILLVNSNLAAKSWIIESKGGDDIVVGPAYAESLTTRNGKIAVRAEQPWGSVEDTISWVYSANRPPVKLFPSSDKSTRPKALPLGGWQMKNASDAVEANFDDKSWMQSDNPLQMGADGDVTANAWYRTKIQVPQTGQYTLQLGKMRERAAIFLDGNRIDTGTVFKNILDLNLQGSVNHTLAIFTSHTGRNKQIFYVGLLDTVDMKGLTGEVSLKKKGEIGQGVRVSDWRMKGGPGDYREKDGWINALPAAKLSRPTFYRTSFTLTNIGETGVVWRVITTSLTSGSVWVNGHNLGRYPEKIKINGLYIPNSWLKKGENSLVIFDESGSPPQRVSVQAETGAGRDVTIFAEKGRY